MTTEAGNHQGEGTVPIKPRLKTMGKVPREKWPGVPYGRLICARRGRLRPASIQGKIDYHERRSRYQRLLWKGLALEIVARRFQTFGKQRLRQNRTCSHAQCTTGLRQHRIPQTTRTR